MGGAAAAGDLFTSRPEMGSAQDSPPEARGQRLVHNGRRACFLNVLLALGSALKKEWSELAYPPTPELMSPMFQTFLDT